MIYVFDNNSLRVISHYYPERFPTFWRRFDAAVAEGAIVSVREVHNELTNWAAAQEWFSEWIKKHRSMFLVPGPRETLFVAKIFKVPHFRTLVGEAQRLKGQPVADPFLIACAKVGGGTVVTEEVNKPNAAKIPNICEHFGVPCTNVEGFLTASGWRF
jgi:hypothetical protein